MTTTTAVQGKPSKKERKMQQRDRRDQRINQTLGFSDRTERLQHDRYSYGTGGGRQRPRRHGGFAEGFREMEPEAETLFVRLIEAITPEAGRESDYPKDANTKARYAVGQKLQVRMIGQVWNVEIVTVTVMFERWRVKIVFLDTDASFAVTAAQLAKLEVLPITIRDHRPLKDRYVPAASVAIAPTHLLLAVNPRPEIGQIIDVPSALCGVGDYYAGVLGFVI